MDLPTHRQPDTKPDKSPRPSPKPEHKNNASRTLYSKKSAAVNAVITDDDSGSDNGDATSEPDCSAVTIEGNFDEPEVNTVTTSGHDPLDNMKVRVKHQGQHLEKCHRVMACPDTGCRTTIIGADIARAIGVKLQPTNARIKAANHSTMTAIGAGHITLKFEGKTIDTKVIISPSVDGRMLVGRRDLISLKIISPHFPSTKPPTE